MTVQIAFRAPPRRDSADSPTNHNRKIQGVPQSAAKEMIDDVRAYESNSSSTTRWKLYQ